MDVTARPAREPVGAPTGLSFAARIGRTGILRSVVVPASIVRALGGELRMPVIARYAGDVTRSTLVPAGGGKRRLVLQMDALRPAGLDAGDRIEISVARARESHKQGLPADVIRALQARPAAQAELERATPSTWRMITEAVEEARAPATRVRRVERIIERLAEMAADRSARARKTRGA